MEKSVRGELYIVFAAIMWSSGGIFIKLIPNMDGIAMNGLRSVLAVLCLALYLRRFPRPNIPIVLGAIGVCVTTNMFVLANQYTTSANAIVLQYTAPIFVMIFTAVKNRKLPSIVQILIMLLAIGGIVTVFADQMSGGGLLGNILAIVSGIAFACVFFVNGMEKVQPAAACMYGFMLNVIVGIPFYFGVDYTAMNVTSTMALVGLGVVQLGIPYILFSIGIERCNSLSASIISLLEAILNPIWVAIFAGELPGTLGLIGCSVVIVAVILNIIYQHFHEKKQSASHTDNST